jgi:hypothetical protein
MKVPTTLYIGINTHGVIDINSDNKIVTFAVPKNINISYISSVAPGVDNILTLDVSEKINKNIDEYLQGQTNNQTNNQTNKSMIVETIVNIARKEETILSKYIKNDYYNNKKVELAHYLYTRDKSFTVKEYTGKMLIYEKRFVEFTEQEISNCEIDIDNANYFNKIVIYNIDCIDLLQQIKLYFGRSYIYLSELITVLVSMGAKNIIFLDLSCNTFLSHNKLTERSIRHMRRNMETEINNIL